MPRGGARPNSGPKPNPNSARQKKLAEKAKRDAIKGTPATSSAKKSTPASSRSKKPAQPEVLGHRFGKLPRAGYTGRVPAWPLASKPSSYETAAWKDAWRTPQAAAWATEPWRWRTVALWVRATVRCESAEAPAAIITAAIKLADQIGMTPAGLALNNWEIEEAPGSRAAAEAAANAAPATGSSTAPPAPPVGSDPRDRLKVIDGAG